MVLLNTNFIVYGGRKKAQQIVKKDLRKFPDSHFEKSVRNIFQDITGKKFPSVYISWLLNEKGNPMELDGYNDELKIAFEAQGPQHYHFLPEFDRTKKEFDARMRSDRLKLKLCEKHGVKLFVIDCRKPMPLIRRSILQQLRA
jgi:hypothetical protein